MAPGPDVAKVLTFALRVVERTVETTNAVAGKAVKLVQVPRDEAVNDEVADGVHDCCVPNLWAPNQRPPQGFKTTAPSGVKAPEQVRVGDPFDRKARCCGPQRDLLLECIAHHVFPSQVHTGA